MTAYFIFLALFVAAGMAVWLVVRSRREPGGKSGVDPDATADHQPPREPRERGETPGS